VNDQTQQGNPEKASLTDDELLARLRAADPADATDPADSWIDDLTEATMSNATTKTTTDTRADAARRMGRPSRRTTWAVGAAAATLVAAAGVGIFAGRGEDPAPPAAKPAKVMTLSLPGSDAAGMCLQFSVDALRPMDVALSGTATQVGTNTVTLTPDHWYRGSDGSTSITLTTLGDSVILEGGIVFEQGKRYLVTATQGTVNACGFSGEWTPQMAAAYAEAFGG
jgi:hypothetical protein